MDINVLKQVKKKGPKKLRGPAAAAAKRRSIRMAKNIQLPAVDDKNPYVSFANFRMEDMSDQIDNFILKLSTYPNIAAKELRNIAFNSNINVPSSANKNELLTLLNSHSIGNRNPQIDSSFLITRLPDPELVWMFRILKSKIPWTMIKPFFQEFVQSGSDNIVEFFKQFYERPSTKEKVLQMNILLKNREATQISQGMKQKWTGDLDKWVDKTRKKYSNVFRTPNLENPRERIVPMFGSGDVMSKCEREYRRAPWMIKFTTETIRGFVVKDVPVLKKYISSKYNDEWYNVKKSWYKDACDGKRQFVEGAVGYTTVKGEIIIETFEMFNTSIREWENETDIKFQVVTPRSFTAAREMLEQNIILPESSIDGVLASINPTINQDMARGLSKVLVYLQPLIQGGNQIHHFRVKNSYYKPEDIINLDRYTVLPEIYKNPNADHVEAENVIKRKRAIIENDFYSKISRPFNPFVRRNVIAKQNIFRYLKTDARDSCPSGKDDIIYYEEDGKIFCFDRVDIANKKSNPFTGKKFKQSFINELNKIRGASTSYTQIGDKNQRVLNMIEKPAVRPSIELAPGLFQKLRAMILVFHCNQCDKEIHSPQYKSVNGSERLYFCSIQCFDDFTFGQDN